MASHDWKSHVAPHFNSLILMNAVVLLTIPLVSHDASANAVSWPKGHFTYCFDHFNLPNKRVPLKLNLHPGALIVVPKAWDDWVMLHLIFIVLTQQTYWCHWWCHPLNMMPVLMPTASYDKETHDALCFNCLDLTMQWCYLWHHWYDVILMLVPTVSHG